MPPAAPPLRLAAGAASHLPIKGEGGVGARPVKKRRTSRPPTHSSLAEMTPYPGFQVKGAKGAAARFHP